MKKIVMALVIATTMFAAFNANAQQDKKFALGIKAGANLSNVYFSLDQLNDFYGTQFKLGFHAGLIAEYKVNRLIGIAVEPMYSLQGFRINEDQTISGQTQKMDGRLNQNFINLPIMIKVYPFKGLFIEACPHADFCLDANIHKEGTINGESVEKNDEDLKSCEDYKAFDFGIGVDYRL